MDSEILSTILVFITTVITLYLKYRHDKKMDIKKMDQRQNELIEQLKGEFETIKESFGIIQSDMTDLIIRQSNIDSQKSIKDNIRKSITDSADTIIFKNHLDNNIRGILKEGAEATVAFAIHTYFSGIRKDRDRISQYAKYETDRVVATLKDIIVNRFDEVRWVPVGNSKFKEMDFRSYLSSSSGIPEKINLLIQRLEENGLDDENYIKLFVNFVDNVLLLAIEYWRKYQSFTVVESKG